MKRIILFSIFMLSLSMDAVTSKAEVGKLNELICSAASTWRSGYRGPEHFVSLIVMISRFGEDDIYNEFERILGAELLDEDKEFQSIIEWVLFCVTRVKYRIPDSMNQLRIVADGLVVSASRKQYFTVNPSWPIGTDEYGMVFLLCDLNEGFSKILYNPLDEFKLAKSKWSCRNVDSLLASSKPPIVPLEPNEYEIEVYDRILVGLINLVEEDLVRVFDSVRDKQSGFDRIYTIGKELEGLGMNLSTPTMRRYGEVWDFESYSTYEEFLDAKGSVKGSGSVQGSGQGNRILID